MEGSVKQNRKTLENGLGMAQSILLGSNLRLLLFSKANALPKATLSKCPTSDER